MKDLIMLANDCVLDLANIGIEVPSNIKWLVNSRAKNRWGQCKTTRNSVTIEISDRLLHEDVEEKAAKTTIYHELLHSVAIGSGHTGEWLKLAKKSQMNWE